MENDTIYTLCSQAHDDLFVYQTGKISMEEYLGNNPIMNNYEGDLHCGGAVEGFLLGKLEGLERKAFEEDILVKDKIRKSKR